MTAAFFGLVGVVIGAVVTAVMNYALQRSQDLRRWEREDSLKFEPERLALYRDFLTGLERARSVGDEDDKMESLLSEMELLSSRAVYERASEAFAHARNIRKGVRWIDGRLAWDEEGYDPVELEDAEDHLVELVYRFNRAVRKELGVVTSWRPTVITHKGKPLGVPEDVEEISRQQPRPWWRRWFGGNG